MSESNKWKGKFNPKGGFLEKLAKEQNANTEEKSTPEKEETTSAPTQEEAKTENTTSTPLEEEKPTPLAEDSPSKVKKPEEKNDSSEKPTPEEIEQSEKIRLNKFIANAGVCSRREADALIANGEITVNGKVVTELGIKVSVLDDVRHNGKELVREKFQYILLNKPADCITARKDDQDRPTVMDYVKDACSERVFPVGRLDRMTTGLLVITNDNELNKRLTQPGQGVKKIYIATLKQDVSEAQLKSLCTKVELKDGFSKFEEATYAEKGNKKKVHLVIRSGKNRIVRRLFAQLNIEVEKLDRVEFAGIKKGALNRGEWRKLSTKEVGFLKMQ